MIDPAHGARSRRIALRRRGQDRRASARRRPAGAPTASSTRAGCVVCPGLRRPVGAAARAGLRVQGDARIGDARRGRRRRHQPRLPAGHRSAARRAGPGRDAEAPRALAQPGARLSGRRADAGTARATTLTEMGELAEAGCVAFSQADAPLADTQVLLRAMQYAATFGYRVWLRPQDAYLAHGRRRARRRGRDAARPAGDSRRRRRRSRSRRSSRSCARPASRVHLCRLSTADGVAMVRAAKRDGLPVTCDVAVHHLHLCDVDIGWFDAQCHLDAAAARARAIATRCAPGSPTARSTSICSDHTPVDDDGKQLPFARSRARRDRPRAAAAADAQMGDGRCACRCRARSRRITTAPASILGIAQPAFRAGARPTAAFSPSDAWTVSRDALKSQGKNTPFLGLEVPAASATRWSRGRWCTSQSTGPIRPGRDGLLRLLGFRRRVPRSSRSSKRCGRSRRRPARRRRSLTLSLLQVERPDLSTLVRRELRALNGAVRHGRQRRLAGIGFADLGLRLRGGRRGACLGGECRHCEGARRRPAARPVCGK